MARLPRDLMPAQTWLYGLEAQEWKGERRHYQRGRRIAHQFSPAGRRGGLAAGVIGMAGGREYARGVCERGMSPSRSPS